MVNSYLKNVFAIKSLPLITLIPIIFYFVLGIGILKNNIKGLIIISAGVFLGPIIMASRFDNSFYQELLMRAFGFIICVLILSSKNSRLAKYLS
jgi:hypothetical protein